MFGLNVMKILKTIFLNERFIMAVILLNSTVIFLQESGYNPLFIKVIDVLCTLVFLVEMIVKQMDKGIREYWRSGWNRFDGILVILSLPSLIGYFVPSLLAFSTVLILRILRVFRFFRLIHLFPDFTVIMRNVRLAMRQSFSVFIGFLVLLVVVGMVNCSIFGSLAPEYFGTPLDSIYSMFRLCTVEGWYEIPEAIVANVDASWGHVVKLYFSILLFAGGVIGLSIVNSIFVDAMVSDNNDEVLRQLAEIRKKLDDMKKD